MGFTEDLVLMIAKGLYAFVWFGEPLVEANGVAPLWSSLVSFLETTCSWTPSYFAVESHGNLCVPCPMCNYDNNI